MEKPIIYIVSDSVGETADLVIKAAVSQFDVAMDIKRVPYVEDKTTVKELVSMAKLQGAIIGFTLVKPDIRNYLLQEAAKIGVEVFDIIGPIIDKMQNIYDITPKYEPGIVRKLDDEYFKRVEAIEFAVKYDDGRDPRGILRADLVLIGVSRTSKTPLSQFLALKRLKVANVPIVPEVDPPEELLMIPKEKCIGLKINPHKLNDIRKERLKSLGLNDGASYATIKRIEDELVYFEKLIDQIGCRVIDVSNKAVEETANVIMSMLQND
ncbi:MAG: phosphoenolpyruvate synthase regulatory protein [Bacillales bacterium]|jgi:regulator of PEP synthase PpsR (kinase-PPPase family)|nr:phosphoenolpyruvate synthase regulatory protein [Bacillales bacterium]